MIYLRIIAHKLFNSCSRSFICAYARLNLNFCLKAVIKPLCEVNIITYADTTATLLGLSEIKISRVVTLPDLPPKTMGVITLARSNFTILSHPSILVSKMNSF